VIADAVTTPYQAAKRASVEPGDNVIVIGATGGVGVYMAQTLRALRRQVGHRYSQKSRQAEKSPRVWLRPRDQHRGQGEQGRGREWRNYCKSKGVANTGWKIFEVTGTKAGQDLALDLLTFVGKLVMVGFGLAKSEYMMSKLMAFDAEIIGTWGCLPEYYPIVLDMVLNKKIVIDPFVEVRAMSTIAATFDEIHKAGSPAKRVVLKPDF